LSGKSFGIQFYKSGLAYSRQIRQGRRKKGQKYFQIYSVSRKGDSFSSGRVFARNLDPKMNLGGTVFSADGKTMLYTVSFFDRRGKEHFRILQARLDGEDWKKEGELSINGKNFSCAFPALSPDEQALFFSSDRPGTTGGMDLYVSYRKANGWSEPENLGEMINTTGNEVYPFLAGSNQLWFASDGHIGLGGMDVFHSEKNARNEWGKPKNPGPTFNSHHNDYCYIYDPHWGADGFLLSDRLDRGERDRVFRVSKIQKEIFKVLVRDELTGQAIGNANVKVVRKSDGVVIGHLKSGNFKGEYVFQLPRRDVETGVLLQVSGRKEEYHAKEVDFRADRTRLNMDLKLKPLIGGVENSFVVDLKPVLYPNRKLAFRNLYFDSNNAGLSVNAKAVLDQLVELLKAFPHVNLKLNAHTDSRGHSVYNQKLSEQRACVVKSYLVQKGIPAENISVKGWGEKYILNRCIDGVRCSEKEHSYNRRLEVIVVL
jgi:outer membrane protein OmpA-like peptidoglycan-associated protein